MAEARRQPDFNPAGWLRNQLLHTVDRDSLFCQPLTVWILMRRFCLFMAEGEKRFIGEFDQDEEIKGNFVRFIPLKKAS